jgi:tRNA pseudouridine55 synthase
MSCDEENDMKRIFTLDVESGEVEVCFARNIGKGFEAEGLTVYADENGDFPLRVHCSKGTYVRTLCHDLGAALGCGGCMAGLRRTKAGIYDLSMAHTLEQILAHPDPQSLLLPADSLFAAYPAVTLTAKQEKFCRNGNPIPNWTQPGEFFRVYGETGEFLMVGKHKNGTLYTEKSFFEVN